MRTPLSLVILATASIGFGGMTPSFAQNAPSAAPANGGAQKQQMTNGGASAGKASAAKPKPEYSHRAMQKRLKKHPPKPQQPQSKRTQRVAKR